MDVTALSATRIPRPLLEPALHASMILDHLFLPAALALILVACSQAQSGVSRSTLDVAQEAGASPDRTFDHSHAAWTAVLAEHVDADTFDYAALAKDRAGFEAYLSSLEAVTAEELAGWRKEQRFAFWINAYNAYTIRKVVDNYPLKSIRKLDGTFGLSSVFDSEFIPLRALHPEGKGEKLSLNDIEHEILRKHFEDARIHAAINCASTSCPPLRAEAFVAERLEKQLDEQMRAFVNDPARNRLDKKRNRLRVSEIFKWFKEDFERDGESVKGYLARWLPEEEHAFVEKAALEYLDYDWSLNEPAKE